MGRVVHLVDVVARQGYDILGAVPGDEVEVLVGWRRPCLPQPGRARLVGLEQAHAAAAAVQVPRRRCRCGR